MRHRTGEKRKTQPVVERYGSLIIESSSPRRPVFVIEDDPMILEDLSSVLRGGGFPVVEFTGIEAVEDVATLNPFMILLDVSLRGSDAVEVLRELDANGYRGAVQLMSGGTIEVLEQLKRVGERRGMRMMPVLRKPFPPCDVLAVVDRESRPIVGQARPVLAAVTQTSDESRVSLAEALSEGWVEIWYQPKFAMRTLELSGTECLARVRHPTRGLIPPSQFLPGATSEAMQTLTEFVLFKACDDWQAFADAGQYLRMAINVPCELLTSMPFARLLRQWRPAEAAWPGLTFEVTEDQALRDIDAVHEIGTQLKIYNIDLSIDDFGLGYSGLARLREIPFREIKLDRTLVDGCARDPTHAAMCRAIIDLAHSLNATTVAEGIEDQADLDYLRDIGCDVAQGFLLGRPMPKDALLALVHERAAMRAVDKTFCAVA